MNTRLNDIFMLFHHGHLEEAKEELNKLEKELKEFDDETYYQYQSTLTYVAIAMKDKNCADKASTLYIERAESNKDMSHLHRAHHQKAMFYRDFGLYDDAEKHLEIEANIINQHLNSEPYLLSVNQCEFGTIYDFQKRYDDSNNQFKLAENNAQGIDDPFLLPCIYRGMGISLKNQDKPEALDYLSRARDMFLELEEENEAKKINEIINIVS